MTTAFSSARVRPTTAGAHDRVFYTSMAIIMALTVFTGFSSTYYLRLISGTPRTVSGGGITPLLHVHGILFSAWVVLFIAQTTLVATRRIATHRRLGMTAVGLAIAMVVVGLKTAISSAARGAAPPGADSITFLVVPIFDIVLFTGFVTAALLKRRNKEAHKRLMLLAYVSIITAGVARLPGLLPLGPLVFFGVSLLFVIAGIVYDKLSRGKIHPVYLWGGAILAVSVPLRLAISGTAAWRTFAEWLVRSA